MFISQLGASLPNIFFLTKTLCAFLNSLAHVTCFSELSLLDLISLMVSGYKKIINLLTEQFSSISFNSFFSSLNILIRTGPYPELIKPTHIAESYLKKTPKAIYNWSTGLGAFLCMKTEVNRLLKCITVLI